MAKSRPVTQPQHRVLIQNWLWMMLGNVVPLGIQAVYFLALTRVLGAEAFGEFVGVVALAGLLAPFVGLGSGTLLVRDGARSRSGLATPLGPAVFTTLWTGVFAGVLFAGFAHVAYGFQTLPTAVVFIGTSELLVRPLLDLVAKSFQAIDRLRGTALVVLFLATARLIAVALLVVTGGGIAQWYIIFFIATVVVGMLGVGMLGRAVQLSEVRPRPPSLEYLRAGVALAISAASHSITTNTDKVMLLRAVGGVESGVYGASVRVLEFASTPFRSLLAVLYARFFREGEGGHLDGVQRLAQRFVPLVISYGGVTAVALWVGAPHAAAYLGDSYQGVANVIRAAAVLPLLRALHQLAADALSGADQHGTRTRLQVGAAVANVLLNLVLIPMYGVYGALGATVSTDALLVCLMWFALRRHRTRS